MAEEEKPIEDKASEAFYEPPEGESEKAPDPRAEKRTALERFNDVEITVDAILGNVSMPLEQFLKLGRGAIVELQQTRYDSMTLSVAGTVIAKGELQVMEDTVGVEVKEVAHKNRMYNLDI